MLSSNLGRVWKTPKEKEDHAEIRRRLKELGICLNLAKEDVDREQVKASDEDAHDI